MSGSFMFSTPAIGWCKHSSEHASTIQHSPLCHHHHPERILPQALREISLCLVQLAKFFSLIQAINSTFYFEDKNVLVSFFYYTIYTLFEIIGQICNLLSPSADLFFYIMTHNVKISYLGNIL